MRECLRPSASLIDSVARARATAAVRGLASVPPSHLGPYAAAWTSLLAAMPGLLQADAARALAVVARVDVLPVLSVLTDTAVAPERLERALLTLWLGLAGHPGLASPLALPGPFRVAIVDPRAPRLLVFGAVRGLGTTARGPVVMTEQGRLPVDRFVSGELPVVGGAVVLDEAFDAPVFDTVARVRGAIERVGSAWPVGAVERITIGRGPAVLGEARVGADGDAGDLVASAHAACVRAAAVAEPMVIGRGFIVEDGQRVDPGAVLARACGAAVALPWRADRAAAAGAIAADLDDVAVAAVCTPGGAELMAALRASLGETESSRPRALLVNPDAGDFVYSFLFGRSVERRCRERGWSVDRIAIKPGRGLDLAAELGQRVPEPIGDGVELLVESEDDPAIGAVLGALASRRYQAVVANVRPKLLYDMLEHGMLAAGQVLLWDRHLHGGLREEGERRGLGVEVFKGPRIRAWSLADRLGEGLHRDLARAGLEHGRGRAWPLDLSFFRPHVRPTPGRVFAGGNNARDWPLLLEAVHDLRWDIHVVTADALSQLPPHVRVDRRLTLAGFRDAMAAARVMALPVHPGVATGMTVLAMAMALGVPIVATRTLWTEQYVSDDETGLLVPPGDVVAFRAALLRLHDDATLRARLVAAARERVAVLCDLDAFTAEMFATLSDR